MTAPVAPHTPYADAEQQREADLLGMYIFLGSEIMLFGGLFAALSAYRIAHPHAAAEAAAHLDLWLGSINTAVLLTSSLLVALAGQAAQRQARRAAGFQLIGAAALGLVFLGIKSVEYHKEYADGLMPLVGGPSPLAGRPSSLFIDLYFVATGLHAVHLTIGVVLLLAVAAGTLRRSWSPPKAAGVVELAGLYWHLVDVIWVFLFPILYLARR